MVKGTARVISFVLTKIVPLFIVLYNHLFYADGGLNVQLIGWLLGVIIVWRMYIKPMDEKVRVWEIQDKNDYFVFNYRHIKNIVFFGFIWWLWVILHSNYDSVYNTLALIFTSLVLGWIIGLYGIKKEAD